MLPGLLTVAAVLLSCGTAGAQPTYSIDFESPTISLPDFTAGIPITEGDILGTHLLVGGPPPLIVITAGFFPPASPAGLGLPQYQQALGHAPGVQGAVEVNALSYGMDVLIDANMPVTIAWTFSVDEWAIGLQPPVSTPPDLTSEGALGAMEASGDLFSYFVPGSMPPGPLPPFAAQPGSLNILDGDGIAPPGLVPLGLIEPNPPLLGPTPVGDNIDAVDLDTQSPNGGVFPVYFSLDSAHAVDLLEGFSGTSSAPINLAASGADVLVTLVPGGPPAVYAPAAALGLDLTGPDTDDLDALILHENGDGVFTAPEEPYDWVGGATDMIFFSVRRGSAVIGMPDSFHQIPIEEGDVLFPFGGPGTPPGIWIAAENLGLCTLRSCGSGPFGLHGDDLDALDVAADCDGDAVPDSAEFLLGTSTDCNSNGVPDDCDIAGGALDCNSNGIPDSCDIDGGAPDCNSNGIPDECEIDCDSNGVPDDCDIAGGAPDCNSNGIP
ncbi:MAG: hypothetical protein ACE5GW_12665, partial [Planctomycetota bacterium]